jgi:hypothetical protein
MYQLSQNNLPALYQISQENLATYLVLWKPFTFHIRIQLLQQLDAAFGSWLSQAILVQEEVDSKVRLVDGIFVCDGELADS